MREVHVNMSRIMTKLIVHLPFELCNQILRRRSYDIVNSVNLIQLVVTRKERVEAQNFKEHTPNTPNIHLALARSYFVRIVAICKQALRRTIPAS